MDGAALGLGLAVAVFWGLLAIDPVRRWPGELFLGPAEAADSPDTVAVLVPARDEAETLPRALPSLLAQDHENLGIVLVDDGSSDGTADVATELAARASVPGRLRVLAAGEKPAGWAGKVWAQSRGLAALVADPEPPAWLLLTDSDIAHPPDSVRRLLGQARRGGYDFVSVMARLKADGGWERLLIPPFVFFFQLLYPFRAVRRRASRVAAAAGGCMLVRTSALLAAGGFEAIRAARIDDVALARCLKRSGARLWLGFAPAIESVRPYRDLREIWRMIARSAFVQLRFSYVAVLGVVAGLAAFFCSPPLLLVAGVFGDGRGAAVTAFAAGLAWVLQARLLWPYARHHRVPAPYALTLPLAAALYAAMTASSAWSHLRGGPRWKGRGYEEPGGSS